MNKPTTSLIVAIVDADKVSAHVLKAIIELKPGIDNVQVYSKPELLLRDIHNHSFNSVIIDIFSVGIPNGIQLIEQIRNDSPDVPICLYSSLYRLTSMTDIPENWQKRFGHYYKLPKDQTVYDLDKATEDILEFLVSYLQSKRQKKTVDDAVSKIGEGSGISTTEEIAELQQLLSIHRKNLYHYLSQEAIQGSSSVGLVVMHGINEARANIKKIKDFLRTNGITVKDHLYDE
jgi:DNA-binding NtrC family response regulator